MRRSVLHETLSYKTKGKTLKEEKKYKSYEYCVKRAKSKTWFISDHVYDFKCKDIIYGEHEGKKWFLIASKNMMTGRGDEKMVLTCEDNIFRRYYSGDRDSPRIDELLEKSP